MIGTGWILANAEPDNFPPLYHISRAITQLTLEFLENVLPLVGLEFDSHAGNSVTRAIVALFLVLPLTALVVLLVSRWIRHRIRRNSTDEMARRRAAFESLLRPLTFLIWIVGITVGISPLFTLAAERTDSLWIFLLARGAILAAMGISIMWFWRAFSRRLKTWATETGRDNADGYRDIVVRVISNSLDAVVPLVVILLLQALIGFPDDYKGFVSKGVGILIILVVSWVLFQIVLSFESVILRRYKLSDSDNLVARKVYTQVHVVQRVALSLITFLAVASILLLFPSVRQFGQTILASAGIAGLVIGLAMQRTLGNLFAGIQIAFTQPIRLDDVVVVEGEWGRIEEITLSYVVVNIWDWRRLVLPISYFIEKPFQNWTRNSASVIGTVFVHVDYRVPVEEFRKASEEIVKANPRWDGNVFCLQVTECTDKTMELRVLVSASDSPKAWDLRCEVREAMIVWLQRNYPECLPKLRIETSDAAQERKKPEV